MDLINSNNNETWRYPRFFTVDLTLNPEDMRHAKQVLRFNRGDKAILCESGVDYVCAFNGDGFDVITSMPNVAEPSVRLRLFQCLPKSDKFDFIVQKAVELGASEIIPVVSKRCVSRPDGKSGAKKIARWNKIAYEAAKQCGRGTVPSVSEIISFSEAVARVKVSDSGIICYECGGERLNDVVAANVNEVALLIGSEGGFEVSEAESARQAGWVCATLGKRILRVETASVTAISVIMNITGNI